MKKFLLILLPALLTVAATVRAQSIAIGERVPELKVSAWLDSQRPDSHAPLTYIEFFHSSNRVCFMALHKLEEYTRSNGLQVIVVVREEAAKIEPALRPYLSAKLSVAFDDDNKTFTAFGVQYVPFGVLIDAKNRAVWMGNTLQLTPDLLKSF